MTAEQQTAAQHAQFWISVARDEKEPALHEMHVQRAIKNLMIASHAR